MIRSLSLALLLATCPAPGWAQPPDVRLEWGECGSGRTLETSECDSGPHEHVLSVSIKLHAPITDVSGIQTLLAFRSESSVLPSWWQLATSGCRSGSLSGDYNFSAGDCVSPWPETVAGGMAAGTFQGPLDPDEIQISVIAAIPGTMELPAGSYFGLARLRIAAGGSGSCSGCELMGCLGVFEVRVTKPAGTPGGDVIVHDRVGSTVSWQCPAETARIASFDKLGRFWEVDCTFDPGNCATPIQSRTWGGIKSLYR